MKTKAKPNLKNKPKKDITSCEGPVIEKCEECSSMEQCLEYGETYYYIILPQWIRNKFFSLLSGSSVKLFVYLVQIAERKESSDNFGKCWPTNENIVKNTGLSLTHIDKQMRQLEKYQIIKRETIKSVHSENKWKTTRVITLLHMIEIKKYRERTGKKRLSLV